MGRHRRTECCGLEIADECKWRDGYETVVGVDSDRPAAADGEQFSADRTDLVYRRHAHSSDSINLTTWSGHLGEAGLAERVCGSCQMELERCRSSKGMARMRFSFKPDARSSTRWYAPCYLREAGGTMSTNRGGREERGRAGERGGKRQRTGKFERGPAGPVATRSQILSAVQSEFAGIRTELRVLLERAAQIQRQLDSIERILSTMLSKAGHDG
jgi:hypothetical protein